MSIIEEAVLYMLELLKKDKYKFYIRIKADIYGTTITVTATYSKFDLSKDTQKIFSTPMYEPYNIVPSHFMRIKEELKGYLDVFMHVETITENAYERHYRLCPEMVEKI